MAICGAFVKQERKRYERERDEELRTGERGNSVYESCFISLCSQCLPDHIFGPPNYKLHNNPIFHVNEQGRWPLPPKMITVHNLGRHFWTCGRLKWWGVEEEGGRRFEGSLGYISIVAYLQLSLACRQNNNDSCQQLAATSIVIANLEYKSASRLKKLMTPHPHTHTHYSKIGMNQSEPSGKFFRFIFFILPAHRKELLVRSGMNCIFWCAVHRTV